MMLTKLFINKCKAGSGSIIAIHSLLLQRWSREDNAWVHTTMDGRICTSDVLEFLDQKGVSSIDSYDYVKMLQKCVKAKDLEVGRQVHDHILRSGVQPNPFVSNTLLKLYTHCGDVSAAQKLFQTFSNKTIVSWNVMISAYAHQGATEVALTLFNQMQQQGLTPDKFTFVGILTACSNLSIGRDIHAQAAQAGLVSDVKVGNALVHMYAKCGSILEARRVFDDMENRDEVSWTTLAGAYATSDCNEECIEIFQQMVQAGIQPSKITYINVLFACVNLKNLELGKHVHAQIAGAGYGSDLRVGTALMKMYLKCGAVECAKRVLANLPRRDVVAWTTVIGGLVEIARWDEAYEAFCEMQTDGLVPNRVTYLSILSSCARPGGLARGKKLHARVTKAGILSDPMVGNALINMYFKAGSVEDARRVFDTMPQRDVISWTSMIGGYAEGDHPENSLTIFEEMLEDPTVVPNKVTYLCAMKACGILVGLHWGREIHGRVVKDGLDSDLQVANAIVSMYFKCGSIDEACQAFERMVTRSTVSWNGLIGGLAQNGRALEALQKFEEMKDEETIKPDSATFVSVLSACRHAGLVEEGRRQFTSMYNDYGILPEGKHYSCLVDILGRAGRLAEAEDVISTLPVVPTVSMWGALLTACRAYVNVEVGERAARESIKLEPENVGVYIALSDLYAAAGRWEDVAKVRRLVKGKKLHKDAGRSCIEVQGKLHSFVANDRAHPRAREIYAELEVLTEKMKRLGYAADTRAVTHEFEDDAKEQSVGLHSEKLAIAFGLLSSPPGTPIRISKNLRVCADCHTASKFISRISGREIVARDAHRFHHFKDGACSCGDYW